MNGIFYEWTIVNDIYSHERDILIITIHFCSVPVIYHVLHDQDFLTELDETEQFRDLKKINLAHAWAALKFQEFGWAKISLFAKKLRRVGGQTVETMTNYKWLPLIKHSKVSTVDVVISKKVWICGATPFERHVISSTSHFANYIIKHGCPCSHPLIPHTFWCVGKVASWPKKPSARHLVISCS